MGGGAALDLRSCLVAHHTYTEVFVNLDESVCFLGRLSETSRCLIKVIYGEPIVNTEWDNRMLR